MIVLLQEEGSYNGLKQWDENYNESFRCVEYQYGKLARRRVHNVTFPGIMLV